MIRSLIIFLTIINSFIFGQQCFPDAGQDKFCLVDSNTGDILTAARTAYGQSVSTYNLNINLLTGEKTTDRNVPSYINWP